MEKMSNMQKIFGGKPERKSFVPGSCKHGTKLSEFRKSLGIS
jgi:hypothetical protein